MANFSASNLVNAQTRLAQKYAAPEMRIQPYPAFALLTANSNVLIEDAANLRTREDRPIEAKLLARQKRNSGAGRTHNHTGVFGDSGSTTLTWTTKSDVTSISIKLLDKNVIGFEEAVANQIEQCCINILEDKETEAITYLRANRATQQPANIQNGTFNAANDVMEISAADKDKNLFFANARIIMEDNFLGRNLDIIGDSRLAVNAEWLANQRTANATNWGYQFGDLNILHSTILRDANYTDGTALVMPAGTVGALNWIPRQNRQGEGDPNTYVGMYGTFRYRGYSFAIHTYRQRADTSGSNGNTQDDVIEFELSLDTSYNKAPLLYTTDRTDSVILQFGQLT
jgi:hypothetical protein